VEAKETTGTVIDLNGATIRFTMKNIDTSSITVNRVTAGVTLTSATIGLFQYQWQSGDTNTTGSFSAEFEVTPSSGGKFTLPIKPDLRINIYPDLDIT